MAKGDVVKTLILRRVKFARLANLFCVEAYALDGRLRWRSWSDISQKAADDYAIYMNGIYTPGYSALWESEEVLILEEMPA